MYDYLGRGGALTWLCGPHRVRIHMADGFAHDRSEVHAHSMFMSDCLQERGHFGQNVAFVLCASLVADSTYM